MCFDFNAKFEKMSLKWSHPVKRTRDWTQWQQNNLFLRQFPAVGGAHVVVQLMHLGRSDDDGRHDGLLQQPADGHLGDGPA